MRAYQSNLRRKTSAVLEVYIVVVVGYIVVYYLSNPVICKSTRLKSEFLAE